MKGVMENGENGGFFWPNLHKNQKAGALLYIEVLAKHSFCLVKTACDAQYISYIKWFQTQAFERSNPAKTRSHDSSNNTLLAHR